MSLDMNNIRSQLAPTWSGVNIALVVVLFLLAWPLGLLMIAYILWGGGLGLNLGRPETFSTAFERVAAAVRAGVDDYQAGSADSNVQPDSPPSDPADFARWRDEEIARLDAQRRALEQERASGRSAAND